MEKHRSGALQNTKLYEPGNVSIMQRDLKFQLVCLVYIQTSLRENKLKQFAICS